MLPDTGPGAVQEADPVSPKGGEATFILDETEESVNFFLHILPERGRAAPLCAESARWKALPFQEAF